MPDNSFNINPITGKFILAGLMLAFAAVLVRTAWLCDDAYITFRVVDNFINGFGPVWNVTERVQVFTHPLWMLLLSSVYFFTREIYFTSLIISIVLGLGAVYLVAFRLSVSVIVASLALLILMVSKAFVEYTTSGLENPLTYLLLAVFCWRYFQFEDKVRGFFSLSLLSAMIALNRPDAILICLPALIHSFLRSPSWKGLLAAIIGMAPLVLWMKFSLIYYGFALPNTFYSKLNNGVYLSDLLVQGLRYFADSFTHDPLTLLFTFAASVTMLLSKDRKQIAIAVGILFYLLYVIRIGGDFMSGRFFAIPLLAAVAGVVSFPIEFTRIKTVAIAGIILGLGFFTPDPALLSRGDYGLAGESVWHRHGIEDERKSYYRATGLLRPVENPDIPGHSWYRTGLDLKGQGRAVQVATGIGFLGFAAGPNLHIVDKLALADPLLARLSVYNVKNWRPGHFERIVPAGYLASIDSSKNCLADSNLFKYYDVLKLITGGEIFSANRLAKLIEFNVGNYDYLIRDYQSTAVLEVPFDSVQVSKSAGTMWRYGGNTTFNRNGLRILFDSTMHAAFFEVSVDDNDQYNFEFYNAGVKSAEYLVDSLSIPSGGLRIDTVYVPQAAYENGFDVIEIHPSESDECYSLGHMILLPLSQDSLKSD